MLEALNSKKLVGGIFCDLQKAFVVLIMTHHYTNLNFTE
jgi:hypothetical protein